MGCTTCKSECGREDGCGSRKAEQKVVLDRLCALLYPDKTWGRPDDKACFRAGLQRREGIALAGALSSALKAPAYYRDGGPDDLCAFIYVLCLGREPALIEARDKPAALAELIELARGPEGAVAVRERYLRISCSAIGRLACVQEVALELDAGGGKAPDGMAVLRELPQPGVFDPKLLKRFQKAVDLIMAHDIQHLDMGLLDLPARAYGLEDGDYADRYGVPPGLLNFFFYAQPVLTAAACYLPLPTLDDALPALSAAC